MGNCSDADHGRRANVIDMFRKNRERSVTIRPLSGRDGGNLAERNRRAITRVLDSKTKGLMRDDAGATGSWLGPGSDVCTV